MTHVQIIAEAGVNHNGSLDMALALVDAAAAAGVDVVKFQTFNARKLASADAPKAAYQVRQTGAGESQLAMLERLQLSLPDHQAIIARCQANGIAFLSTPFDFDSLALLTDVLKLDVLKIGSGELTNAPMLLALARSGRRLILSTGMGTLGEVEDALGVLAFGMVASSDTVPSRQAFASALHDAAAWSLLRDRVTLLHCTTEYPAAVAHTNLRAMQTMRQAFGLEVGYSDHTEGAAVSIAAVAMGATVIEKHVTLDRKLPGPDHAASVEPGELASLVRDVRAVELALGSGIKQPGTAERANRPVARKSLVAARDLGAGHVLTAADIEVKRPGSGRSPFLLWEAIGLRLTRAYRAGEPLDP